MHASREPNGNCYVLVQHYRNGLIQHYCRNVCKSRVVMMGYAKMALRWSLHAWSANFAVHIGNQLRFWCWVVQQLGNAVPLVQRQT